MLIKKDFSFFCAVSSAFGFKVRKKCYYDPKNNFFHKKSRWVSKNAEFDADFRFVKKTAKTFTDKKLLLKNRSKNDVF